MDAIALALNPQPSAPLKTHSETPPLELRDSASRNMAEKLYPSHATMREISRRSKTCPPPPESFASLAAVDILKFDLV